MSGPSVPVRDFTSAGHNKQRLAVCAGGEPSDYYGYHLTVFVSGEPDVRLFRQGHEAY